MFASREHRVSKYLTPRLDLLGLGLIHRDVFCVQVIVTLPPDDGSTDGEYEEPQDPSVVLQRVLPYTARAHMVQDLPAGDTLELCVLAKDSAGNVRRWRRSQCRMLPPSAAYQTGAAAARGPAAWAALAMLPLLALCV